MNDETKIKNIFKEKSILKSKDLATIFGSRTNVQRLVKKEIIFSLGSGYYSQKKMSPFSSRLHILSLYYPEAIITGKSALYLHGIFNKEPEDIEIVISEKKSLKNSLFIVKRTKPSNTKEIKNILFEKLKVTTFCLEKILVSLSKYKKDSSLLNESLRLIKKNKIPLNKKLILKFDIDYKTNFHSLLIAKTTSTRRHTEVNETKTKEIILEVGLNCYIESGLQGITMQMIADKAKISKSKLCKIFKTKNGFKVSNF